MTNLSNRDRIEILKRRISYAVDKQLLLMNKLIAAEDELARLRNGTGIHLNPRDQLPPVDCPLLIEVSPGELIRACRPTFAATKSSALVFDTEAGQIEGRFRWTYP
jgi:hypothetical protein